jgi:hypothetical protein
VRIVRENTLSLQKLIEDLLRWHQTRVVEPATVGPVELPDIVRRVVREQKLAALARMIAFDTHLEPAVVTGDAERIRTIVDNLVSNAIKYSPRSGTIDAKLRTRDGLAVLEVADEGTGGPGCRARERVRVVLPGRAADRGARQGQRARPRDRARIRARARRPRRGRRPDRRARAAHASGSCSARDGTARRRVRAARPDGGGRVTKAGLAAVGVAALVAGCASMPDTSPSDITLYDDDVAPLIIAMTPMQDAPPLEPIEPVEPPMIAPPLLPAPTPAPVAAPSGATMPPSASNPPAAGRDRRAAVETSSRPRRRARCRR